MSRLLRLFAPKPIATGARLVRETIPFVLADGRRIDVLRVRDPRAKRLKLSVDERGARLTLPTRASLVSGERFLYEHRDWLGEQFAAFAHACPEGLVHGASTTLPLRGADLPLRWVEGRVHRVGLDDAGLWFETPARASAAAMSRALRDFYEAQARGDIARWMPRHLPGLPRPPSRVLLKRMSSQWGSLAPDATLALDLSLVLARPSAFEYVLVHELCHLARADHSPAFWREVEARFPAWKDQRDYFHAEGRRLKATLRALLG
jgi:predicted metal-dependent hydrolase